MQYAFAFFQHGNRGDAGKIGIWDINTGKEQATIPNGADAAYDVSASACDFSGTGLGGDDARRFWRRLHGPQRGISKSSDGRLSKSYGGNVAVRATPIFAEHFFASSCSYGDGLGICLKPVCRFGSSWAGVWAAGPVYSWASCAASDLRGANVGSHGGRPASSADVQHAVRQCRRHGQA
jgi:hypothetical protein